MKIAFLYGGQGSQKLGMGKDFYDDYPRVKTFYDKFPKIRDISFLSDEKVISNTVNTQPCMIAFDVIVTDLLKSNKIIPDMTAGLSIGEYGALYCANVFSADDVIKISIVRGQAMEDAICGKETMMCACIGIEEDKIHELCQKHSTDISKLEIANLNCPNQIVIGGGKDGVKALIEQIKKDKLGRAIKLRVSGAFHTSYMEPAGQELKDLFKNISFNEMDIPVVFNLLGREKNKDEIIADLLVKQVQKTVHFESCIRYMIEQGVDTFVEIGFAGVIAGFIKKISPDLKVLPCYDTDTYKKVLEYFRK